jgi:hypothetical protein
MSLQDAINAGRKTAQDGKPDYNKIFNKDNAQGAVPHNESDEKTSFWQDASNKVSELLQAGAELLMTCMSGGEGPNDQLRCEAVRMLMNAKEKKAAREELVKPDDPLVLMRDMIAKDPAAIAGNWAGEYSDCEETTVDIGGDFEYRVCSDVIPIGGVEEDVCTLGENVILDPGTLYQCNRTIAQLGAGQCSVGNLMNMDAAQTYQCGLKPENRETVPCETTRMVSLEDKCLDQAITGVQADMESSLTAKGGGEYLLTFGRKGRGYWNGGEGTVFDRTLTFTINNLQAIGVFSAFKVEYDDWLQIKVNGVQVFNGPNGGDRLEISDQCRFDSPFRTNLCDTCSNAGANISLLFSCNREFASQGDGFTQYGIARLCSRTIGSCNVPYYLEQFTDRYEGTRPLYSYRLVVRPTYPSSKTWLTTSYPLFSYSVTGLDIAEQGQKTETVNVNLVPYLKDGVNTITTRTIVGGTGDTYIEFLLRTLCDEWDDGCASLGSNITTTTE